MQHARRTIVDISVLLSLYVALAIPAGASVAMRRTTPVPGRANDEARPDEARPQAGPTAETRPAKVRGVTISTHGIGLEWADPSMRDSMREIKELGAGWVAIHPYAGIRADGSLRRRHERDGDPPAHWVMPIRYAHELGLRILIKPHLAYWGSPFAWRGQIAFDSIEAWRRFWNDYTQWIVELARACRDADGFVVGTELDQTLDHEARWRDLIARVRSRTKAPLTYAANWSHYQSVSFWDALDVVGIQAYFPLAEEPTASAEAIRAGWHERLGQLRRYAEKVNRNIVFTELGYDHSRMAAVRPWEPRQDGDDGDKVQELCMKSALEAVESEPRIVGVFLWKWFPGPRPVGRSYQLATPEMRHLIGTIWKAAGPG